jgi:hypothetical protein
MMGLSKLADVRQYARARTLNIELWSPIVWSALSKLREGDTGDALEVALRERFFTVVANQAIWAATEICSDLAWKYGAQRNFSVGVQNRWKDANSPELNYSVTAFSKGLRHEHVRERRELTGLLRAANDVERIREILGHSESCIVLANEDPGAYAGAKGKIGWNRYKSAGIEVWDRIAGGKRKL